jgi:hypothetical protein
MNKKVKVALGILGGSFGAFCIFALGYNKHMKKTNPGPKPPKHTNSKQIYIIR